MFFLPYVYCFFKNLKLGTSDKYRKKVKVIPIELIAVTIKHCHVKRNGNIKIYVFSLLSKFNL